MDYSTLNAVVLADKIPKHGNAEFDRLSMLKRLGFPIEGREINTSDDSLFVQSVKDMLPQPVRLIDYLSPSEGKFKFGFFLALDKDGAFVNIPLEAIRIISDSVIANALPSCPSMLGQGAILNTEENDAGKDFDQVEPAKKNKELYLRDTMNIPVVLPESMKKIGRPKKG